MSNSKFASKLVPLKTIATNAFQLIELTLSFRPSDGKADGRIDAVIAGIRLAESMYYEAHPTFNAEDALVSLIKDTEEYGNTSVSMGLAVSRNPPVRCLAQFVLVCKFLNCGTGDIKQQYYLIDQTGVRRCLHEYKPKAGVNVQNADKMTDEQVAGFQQNLAAEIKEGDRQLAAKLGEFGFSPEFIKFTSAASFTVFVTGTLRNEHDEATPERKSELDRAMDRLFDFGNVVLIDTPRPKVERWGSAPTYFMPQDTEGRMEFIAVNAMHANLAEAKQIPADAKIVSAVGIGNGTCQQPVLTEEGKIEVIGFPFGMRAGHMLADMPHANMKRFMSIRTDRSAGCPIIGWKSGVLLLLDSDKEYCKKFMAQIAGR